MPCPVRIARHGAVEPGEIWRPRPRDRGAAAVAAAPLLPFGRFGFWLSEQQASGLAPTDLRPQLLMVGPVERRDPRFGTTPRPFQNQGVWPLVFRRVAHQGQMTGLFAEAVGISD